MKQNKSFAVTDIEARDWIKFLCIGLYDGKNYKAFTSLESYFSYLHNYEIKTIFAHFGGIYDFLFLLGYILDSDEWILDSMIPRGSSLLCFSITSNETGNKFTFTDSSALLGFSLKSLAENFNVETKKGSIDYDKIKKVTPELLDYMKDDHLALYQILERFFEWDLIAKHGWKVTLASQALHLFKKEFYPKKKTLRSLSNRSLFHGTLSDDAFVRRSYQGGRTEIFKMIHDNGKNLYCYDVNSLYPSVMLENDFPSTVKFTTTEFIKGELGFYHCKVFAPDMHIPILGTKIKIDKTESFIFPVGEFIGTWSEHELSYAIENGYKILEIYEGRVFQNDGKIFKSYVNYFYKKRLKSKNDTDKMICKLLLNSLYGRFGMDTEKEQLCLERHIEGEKFHSTITTESGNKYDLYTKLEDIYSFTNVAVASYVTSYARVKMHKLLKPIEKDVFYMDTDSIFTTKKLKSDPDLGELKLEYTVNKACFMLPKTYLVEAPDFKKVVMKGFDKKKIQHFKFEDFTNSLEGDLKVLNKQDKNILKVKHDSKVMRFRSAIKTGNTLKMSKTMIKRICSKYNKRIVNKDFTTSPINAIITK